MVRLLLALSLCLPALAATVSGRVTGPSGPLEGVRVYPDRTPRVRPAAPPPVALTGADGRFSLAVDPGDRFLVVEKPGLQRDLVPLADAGEIRLAPAPEYRKEPVVVVRLDLPGLAQGRDDAGLRRILFDRTPGAASAAAYFYEISKGSLDLEEAALLHVAVPARRRPWRDADRRALVLAAVKTLKRMDLARFDKVDNRTGALKPDGRPDHLWVVAPGIPGVVTEDASGLTAICLLEPLPWKRTVQWPAVFFTEETPLGFIAHEALHAMGEHRVDDFYLAGGDPLTAGAWDLMDAGMFRGWDRFHPDRGPWQEDTAYSPSQPMGWVRTDLWYHGRFKATVPSLTVRDAWEGWLDPLERAPGAHPQRLLVPDPRRRGRFWEFNVRRPLGSDRGRVADRWGPGYEGLVVARVAPDRLTREGVEPRGPVRVVDAHPGTPEPARPRYPGGRWQLDDAAFGVGPGEIREGRDGPLRWEVLEADGAGRLRIKVGRAGSARAGR